MEDQATIKEQLVKHLNGGEAFMPVDEILKKIPFEKIGERPENLPYSFYELFYHIWFSQKDILEYCKAEDYKKYNWPQDYWPEKSKPESETEWKGLQQTFFATRKELIDFLRNPENDLLKPVRSNTEHSLLREILLVIEHNAYHTGQLLVILRNLGLYNS